MMVENDISWGELRQFCRVEIGG